MSPSFQQRAILALRWSLGLMVVTRALRFAFEPAAAHYFAETGLPTWVRPGLAWAEIVAAVLFLSYHRQMGRLFVDRRLLYRRPPAHFAPRI